MNATWTCSRIVGEPGEYSVSVMLVRGGRNLGTTSYFPRAALAEPDEALASFIMQYYATQEAPPEILVEPQARRRGIAGAGAQHAREPRSARCALRRVGWG